MDVAVAAISASMTGEGPMIKKTVRRIFWHILARSRRMVGAAVGAFIWKGLLGKD
jgi:hypothetical protein